MKVLLAGATGYLGKFIAKELVKQGYETSVIVRNKKRFLESNIIVDDIYDAEVTNPETLDDCFKN
ncbi:MAG: NAD(P)H-binding protein, partial [Ignavibacteriae bacterium]|nr:NAD(P)H-binding protein [Ignavibacteriota bacterium]